MKVKGIVLSFVLGVVVAAGLYLAGRHWLSSSGTQHTTRLAGAHPMAPGFKLTSVDGKLINLEHYRGKVVLLNFWATWCGPCRMEIPGLEDLQRKYGFKGLRVIGMDVISEDNANAVREFYQRFKMNYPVVLANEKIGDLYGGIMGTPTSILIGCNGRIDSEFVGYTNEHVFARRIHGLLAACPNG